MPGPKDKLNQEYMKEFMQQLEESGSEEIKQIAAFMTDGSWEKADTEKKKSVLSDYMKYQAIQYGGENEEDNPYLENVEQQPIPELIDLLAEKIPGGLDCFILINSTVMDELAFPGLTTGEPKLSLERDLDDTLSLLKDQKDMIEQVAEGEAASTVLGNYVLQQS